MGGYAPTAKKLRAVFSNYFEGRDEVKVQTRIGHHVDDIESNVTIYPNWLSEYVSKTDVSFGMSRYIVNQWEGPWHWGLRFASVVFWNEDLYKEALNGHEHLYVQLRSAEIAEGLRRYLRDELKKHPEWRESQGPSDKEALYVWNPWYCYRKNRRQHAYIVDVDRYRNEHLADHLDLREFIFKPNRKFHSDRTILECFEEFNALLKQLKCPDFVAESFDKIETEGLGSVCDLSRWLEKNPVETA